MRRSSVLILPLLFAVSLVAQRSAPAEQPSPVPAAVYEQMSPEPPPLAAMPQAVRHTADGKAILADGTSLLCRLKRDLYSQKNSQGDQVEFEVLNQVELDGMIVVPRGATAWGVIADIASRRRVGRGGKLLVAISGVRLANGETVKLRATPSNRGGRNVLAESGALGGRAFQYIPLWYLFPLLRGDEVMIPADTEVVAYVDGDAIFDPTANGSQPQLVPVAVAQVEALPEAVPVLVLGITHLSLVSKPDGAEIFVDSAPTGETPGTLSLTPGDHVVRVTKTGFRPYEKKFHVNGGNISLVAELDAVQQ
jgi:hypothetical protein